MNLLLLLACGSSEPLAQPNAPPSPPPALTMPDPNLLTLTGHVSDVHATTRSWVVVGDGQRTIAILGETGVLEIGGRAALVGDLAAGSRLTATGRQTGDVLIVQRAEVEGAPAGAGTEAAPPAPAGETPEAAPTPPAAPAAPVTPAPG